ncbi:class I SAM-dependent methyltransferase [Roseomonas sp. OT10]|uniref:class I SAM-dependent DNA methyltransferase n=1 Tax=Roseomonas cutis TaxID=2897332 RepID=UPI001E3FF619|nr:class I SAM-dependent methyltransferase [Roseomonas sp. OT10]UFN46901.1 class I SAM-dependent methyltransferase [Roseomonas sp. OT10]
MSRPQQSLPASFFEAFYAAAPDGDPWSFATSDYERGKYAATLAALPRPRYGSGFEAGCSIGVLTRQLAARCDRLLAVDAAEAPLAQARQRNAELPQVEIRQAVLPGDWPQGEAFDLILLSELLYFFSREDVAALAGLCLGSLRPGGDVVLVHWLPEAEPPYPLTGDEAVTAFLAACGPALRPLLSRREALYRLDVLRRA